MGVVTLNDSGRTGPDGEKSEYSKRVGALAAAVRSKLEAKHPDWDEERIRSVGFAIAKRGLTAVTNQLHGNILPPGILVGGKSFDMMTSEAINEIISKNQYE